MLGGSRLGPAVLPCQHARRRGRGPGAGGAGSGVAAPVLAFACCSAAALQPIGGSGRPSEAGEEAGRRGGERSAGGCVRIGTRAARVPATCRTLSPGSLDCPAPHPGGSPWHGAPPLRVRARLLESATGSTRLRPPRRDYGCARRREGGPDAFIPGTPTAHTHRLRLAPFAQCAFAGPVRSRPGLITSRQRSALHLPRG